MRKATLFFAVIMLFVFCSCGISESGFGEIELSEVEIALYALSAFYGDGFLVPFDKLDGPDEVNSRFLMISKDGDEEDQISVLIRTSDTHAYAWILKPTMDNVRKAKLIFDKSAPLCFAVVIEDGERKDVAMYANGYENLISYEKFMKDVDSMTSVLSIGEQVSSVDGKDPVLSVLPGLKWGMSKQEIISKYLFDKQYMDSNDFIMAGFVDGDEFIALSFSFKNLRLQRIETFIDDEEIIKYQDMYTLLYGAPKKVMYYSIIIGNIKEDANGDSFVWETGDTCVVLHDGKIEYMAKW